MEPALNLLRACREGTIQLHQPVHFTAEVAAVLVRKQPAEVESDLADLLAIERRTVESLEIYTRAADLAQRYQHHLFDTLYTEIPVTQIRERPFFSFDLAAAGFTHPIARQGFQQPQPVLPVPPQAVQTGVGVFIRRIAAVTAPPQQSPFQFRRNSRWVMESCSGLSSLGRWP